jgi:hypothetical protein
VVAVSLPQNPKTPRRNKNNLLRDKLIEFTRKSLKR